MSRKPNRPTSEQFTVFHLQPQHAGETLAGVLKQLLPKTSWGQTQQWVRQRHVQVNGNLCLDPARRVTEKDVLKLWREPLAKPVTAQQLKLPYLDEHLLVVEKPAGITSVWHRQERRLPARRRQLQPTLEELLTGTLTHELGLPRDPRAAGRPNFGGRPNKGQRHPNSPTSRWPVFPVHRLDRDTSGLMLFARTRLAEQKLVAMFRDHQIQRQYWAVAQGHVQSQTVRTVLVRDRGDGLRGSASPALSTPAAEPALPGNSGGPSRGQEDNSALQDGAAQDSALQDEDAEGQQAITHVELLETIGDYSLVRCRLETGRTHQIRIHLSELGHPLCGEKTYVRPLGGETLADHSLAPRQALHAERLAFIHPLTGERLQFQMVLPPDLKNWLKRLRSSVVDQGRA